MISMYGFPLFMNGIIIYLCYKLKGTNFINKKLNCNRAAAYFLIAFLSSDAAAAHTQRRRERPGRTGGQVDVS